MANTIETISLRTAAKQLGRLKKQKGKTIDDEQLLKLLRKGEISSGVRFDDSGIKWIEIPEAFWETVKFSQFSSIRKNPNDLKKRGIFTVKLSQIADVYLAAVESSATGEAEILRELRKSVQHGSTDFEVEIPESNWSSYLERRGVDQSEGLGGRGAPRKEGWRELCSLIAIHMLVKHKNDKPSKMKAASIAADLYAAALKKDIDGLPAQDNHRGRDF